MLSITKSIGPNFCFYWPAFPHNWHWPKNRSNFWMEFVYHLFTRGSASFIHIVGSLQCVCSALSLSLSLPQHTYWQLLQPQCSCSTHETFSETSILIISHLTQTWVVVLTQQMRTLLAIYRRNDIALAQTGKVHWALLVHRRSNPRWDNVITLYIAEWPPLMPDRPEKRPKTVSQSTVKQSTTQNCHFEPGMGAALILHFHLPVLSKKSN